MIAEELNSHSQNEEKNTADTTREDQELKLEKNDVDGRGLNAEQILFYEGFVKSLLKDREDVLKNVSSHSTFPEGLISDPKT